MRAMLVVLLSAALTACGGDGGGWTSPDTGTPSVGGVDVSTDTDTGSADIPVGTDGAGEDAGDPSEADTDVGATTATDTVTDTVTDTDTGSDTGSGSDTVTVTVTEQGRCHRVEAFPFAGLRDRAVTVYRGSWETVEKAADGSERPNRTAAAGDSVVDEVARWADQ